MEDLVQSLVDRLRDSIRSGAFSEADDAVRPFPLANERGTTIRFKKTPVLRVLRSRASLFLEIKSEFIPYFELENYVAPSSEKGWSRTDYCQFIVDSLIRAAPAVYAKCNIEERIGCCSQYIECSDARKCIKPDVPWAAGCRYRENLENGKIFYGKNRNIP